MKKNVLIALGSARQGNTLALCNAFMEGAKAAGHEVTLVNVANKKILGCRGCENCFVNGRVCVQHDAMEELYPLYQNADVLVLASPIYFSGMTGQLKCFLDRTYANEKAPHGLKAKTKQAALILTAGSPEGSDAFESAIKIYTDLIKYQSLADGGILTAGPMGHSPEAVSKEYLSRAYEMGKNL
ncbi:MAG: flavodoxin family protein [Clostridiales bacterium]|nr:flavodoxin family protein [Clostridiales bacterium]